MGEKAARKMLMKLTTVRLRIGPLVKLGRLKSRAENFLVYILTISFSSGPIGSLASWYTKSSP